MASRAGDTSSGGIYPAWPPSCEGHGNTEEACPKCMYVKYEPEEVFNKILTPSDIQHKGSYRLYLVKPHAARFCFPANGSEVIVYDVQMKPWTMRFRTSRGSAYLTRGWSRFAQAKQLSEGDSITFYELNCKRRTGKRVFMIGASRKECIQILGTPIN
ncbi:hypothetical protein FH972_018822 [Carpinus fangiana]|uniref:TF-B3 domain-containing protein n=1 Tax=Carpinus fangiana TaxID=176857 RepID=A0A5N6RRR7_9ROSI|nr:hypothetical protein FH972_018822 [Carpinus fangiana]